MIVNIDTSINTDRYQVHKLGCYDWCVWDTKDDNNNIVFIDKDYSKCFEVCTELNINEEVD